MRRLTSRISERLPQMNGTSDEDGVMLVFIAATLVVLLGAMAVSVDVGRIYQERRELQNGADAAALAVAHDCASGDCGASQATAEQYADANAGDGLAGIEFVDINHGAKKVTVRTLTDGADGSRFPMTIAQVVGFDGLTVRAQATVAWDGLKAGPVLPVLFRGALWADVSPGSLSTLEEVMSGSAPADRLVTIAHRSDTTGLADPSSARFEWLVGSVGCSVDVEVGKPVEHRGSSPDPMPPADCQGAALNDILNHVLLVPFFVGDLETAPNSKTVVGIGALYVASIAECGDSSYCITGYFVSDYVVDGPLGGGEYGVSAIRFVSE